VLKEKMRGEKANTNYTEGEGEEESKSPYELCTLAANDRDNSL